MKYLVITEGLTIDGVNLKKDNTVDLPYSVAQSYLIKGYIAETEAKKKK